MVPEVVVDGGVVVSWDVEESISNGIGLVASAGAAVVCSRSAMRMMTSVVLVRVLETEVVDREK